MPRASYILDLTDLPPDAQATHSGTGFGDRIKAQHKKNKKTFKPVNKIPCKPGEHVGAKPHLASHYALQSGMPCLKEAMRMLTTYYPELLECIYFYNPPWWFHPIFAVFSLWAKKDTRRKFKFVKKGAPVEQFWTINKGNLSRDFGGDAMSHGVDDFVERAIAKYDSKVINK
ncbi:hypothetical protein TrST_g2373 [Triparma strigata]|uniref:CRAL-TRIO domain-containing protein n=2 Tax=Triparma TaxID=722752 RepID=A0A9W7EAG1_9STRA|nr:hypothetical protein TrST_g2373 [Triparma strigata]